MSLSVYYLPSIWAEVEFNEQEKDNIVTYISISGVVFKYYAKYILINNILFEAIIEEPGKSYNVSYFDEDNNNLLTLLEKEDFAKFYIEAIEDLMYFVTDSNKNTINLSYIIGKDSESINIARKEHTILFINYSGILTSLNDFSENYRGKGYNTLLLNEAFLRAYNKASLKEYRT